MWRHVLQLEVVQRAIEVSQYLCRCTPFIRLFVLSLRSSESPICVIMCIKFHFNPMLSSWVAIFNVPECKFIMMYQYQLTKFVQLRPLKTKRSEEVAYHVLSIFLTFGAAVILQSDNGKEFSNQIISEICAMLKDIKIVHGKPRHSQTQGSVEEGQSG
ncbi:SCAN domain-containing protein 3 [Trichonephila clavipes]|nr:SCAN domain-containing protein 3 [Trichonephila clavipes]